MIKLTEAHRALLASRNFDAYMFYELTLVDGAVLRLSGSGEQMRAAGEWWQGGVVVKHDTIRRAVGLEAEAVWLTVQPGEAARLLGLPWRQAVANGALEGAALRMIRAHAAPGAAEMTGSYICYAGEVGESEVGVEIRLSVSGPCARLDRQVPASVYQPGCTRTIYTTGCALPRAAHQVAGAVQANSSRQIINTALPGEDGLYAGGELRVISGLCAGSRRSVSQFKGGVLTLSYPLPFVPAEGDQFQLWPGCDGTYACCAKFGNTAHFSGARHVPAPETAL